MPLRILMVCPQFRPLVGGYERAAERLSLALCARGHGVTVLTERRERAWPARERLGDVEVVRTWCVARPRWHTLSSALSLLAFLLRRLRSFDVVHVHQAGWPAALCIVAGHLFGRPVVLKLAGSGAAGSLALVARASLSPLLFGLHRRVDALIATSERMAEEAVARGVPPERLARIPNPVDTERFQPPDPTERANVRTALGLDARVVVLFMGRLSPEKNGRGLVEAWARLGPPPDALLVIAGDGPERASVEAQARAVGVSVRTLGPVADPLPWYQAADLFVLPSLSEGLSNSLLEALACGLPVVSTPVSGSEDVFAEADVGCLVPGFEPETLAAGLAGLIADAGRRARCSRAARAHAVARFSTGSVTSQVEALYRALLSGSRVLPGSQTPIARA